MSLIASWLAFPLLLAAIGLGWGVLVERAAGIWVADTLVIPLGLAAALVVAGMFTSFAVSASAATPIVAVGAGAGLIVLIRPRLLPGYDPPEAMTGIRRWRLPGGWPALAALGAFLAYGAPVLLTGQATFTGYVKLDDTATWFNAIDIVMHHSNSLTAMAEAFHPPSTFTQVFIGDVGEHYPLGAFMLPGVGTNLTGIDVAWIIQPYFACCAAALALGIYTLVTPLVSSRPIRALIAFIAAQPELLYGYSLWGGVKEMTAAFVLVLGISLFVPLLRRPPARLRETRVLIPLAIAGGALIQTLQIGGGGWVGPAFVILAIAWVWPRPSRLPLRPILLGLAVLVLLTAAFILPVWVSLGGFLSKGAPGLFSEGQTHAELYGNLFQPISGWQLAGVWPRGDFRLPAPFIPTALFVIVVILSAAGALFVAVRRRHYGPALYVGVILVACALVYLAGGTPWVLGKSLAISSPALLTAGLLGGALLWATRRRLPAIAGAAQAPPGTAPPPSPPPAGPGPEGASRGRSTGAWRSWAWVLGPVVMLVIAGGVLWSNVLSYTDTTIAPRDRMAELQHIGELVKGKGPTFENEYEVYGDRHFLREGAPVEPAEYRPVTVPLRNGAVLTKTAWANLDAFPLSTLLPYRSIVTRRSPTESRPPSTYQLVYQGRYYQLWQRPESAPTILEDIPYGEPNKYPYCGNAESGAPMPVCSLNPVSIPSCPQLSRIGARAAKEKAHLVAYQRAEPDVVRGDEMQWPGAWLHQSESHTLTATVPGTAKGQIAIPSSQTYELFLGGNFGRGFEVKVDGRNVGSVHDQLSGDFSYIPVTKLYLTKGVHTFEYTYPHAGLGPGSGESVAVPSEYKIDFLFTDLLAVVLQPLNFPHSELISVGPSEATKLCGRPLEWVEVVSNA